VKSAQFAVLVMILLAVIVPARILH